MDWKNILPFVNTGLLVFVAIIVTYGTFFQRKQNILPNKQVQRPPVQVANIDMKKLTAGAHFRGASNPKVTIAVFNSFTCSFCRQSKGVTDEIIRKYPNDIQFVYRHYNRSETDATAGEAAECAGDQGKFWEMYDIIFEQGVKMDYLPYARVLGLQESKFNQCMTSSKYRKMTWSSTEEGRALGIRGTPAFVINGKMMAGYKPLPAFERILQDFF